MKSITMTSDSFYNITDYLYIKRVIIPYIDIHANDAFDNKAYLVSYSYKGLLYENAVKGSNREVTLAELYPMYEVYNLKMIEELGYFN